MFTLKTVGVPTLAAVLIISQTLMPALQQGSNASLRDNSDWWSTLGRPDFDESVGLQEREPAASNFQILGINLISENLFREVATKLGKAVVVHRGDASAGRSQVCYVSPKDSPTVHLIFEQGEVADSFYLFVGGPEWEGSKACARTNLITKEMSTASGIQLGQSPSQLKATLGEPSSTVGNTLTWAYGVQKRTSAKDLERVRKQHPELNDEDFHRNYDLFYLGARIEARFSDSMLTYFAVLESETY